MGQKKVSDRFKVKPSIKEYNFLSIFLNYYYSVERIKC